MPQMYNNIYVMLFNIASTIESLHLWQLGRQETKQLRQSSEKQVESWGQKSHPNEPDGAHVRFHVMKGIFT